MIRLTFHKTIFHPDNAKHSILLQFFKYIILTKYIVRTCKRTRIIICIPQIGVANASCLSWKYIIELLKANQIKKFAQYIYIHISNFCFIHWYVRKYKKKTDAVTSKFHLIENLLSYIKACKLRFICQSYSDTTFDKVI